MSIITFVLFIAGCAGMVISAERKNAARAVVFAFLGLMATLMELNLQARERHDVICAAVHCEGGETHGE